MARTDHASILDKFSASLGRDVSLYFWCRSMQDRQIQGRPRMTGLAEAIPLFLKMYGPPSDCKRKVVG
jgi:hypothetical protein